MRRVVEQDRSPSGAFRRYLIRQQLRMLRTAARRNRRDDGRFGNHRDDFDEPTEGFRDKDGNGVGETPRRIACGHQRDRHPLARPPARPQCERR